jgi:hypothetical protein
MFTSSGGSLSDKLSNGGLSACGLAPVLSGLVFNFLCFFASFFVRYAASSSVKSWLISFSGTQHT